MLTTSTYPLLSVLLLSACGSVAFGEASACIDCGKSTEPEFIIVGSGAGGGTLAARLARAGHRVLVLEAGEDVGGKLTYQVPAMHALSTEAGDAAWWFFVKHSTDEAVGKSDSKYTPEGILYPRGSALGGSTAVNAMVSVLPPGADWNRLAQLTGDASWRAANMTGFDEQVQEWLSPQLADPRLALADSQVSSFLTAAAQTIGAELPGSTAGTGTSLGTLLQADLNQQLRGGETTGLFRLPLATREGRRVSTRERLLDTVAQGYPLTVVTGAFVTKLLWSQVGPRPRAVGVEYVKASHVYQASLQPQPVPEARQQALASREVIVSAGTFNTPQLLLLSGVGDAAALTTLGLPVVVDRPGVGKNLQDRYEAPVVYDVPKPLEVLRGCTLGDDASDPCLADWRSGHGVYETPGFLATVLLRSKAQSPLADLQIFAAPTDVRGYYPGYSRDAAATKTRFSWLILKAHTHNTDGEVRLKDASPFSRPDIHFHSYDEQDPLHDPDLLALVEGVKFVRRMRTHLTGTDAAEVRPGPSVQSDEQVAAWVRKESWGHHACCTSKMGAPNDPAAVIDSRFRVYGADGLRVVDASSFPEIPGTFIAMPIFMAAERAAAFILEDLQ